MGKKYMGKSKKKRTPKAENEKKLKKENRKNIIKIEIVEKESDDSIIKNMMKFPFKI
jgi:hypothetical protein